MNYIGVLLLFLFFAFFLGVWGIYFCFCLLLLLLLLLILHFRKNDSEREDHCNLVEKDMADNSYNPVICRHLSLQQGPRGVPELDESNRSVVC